MLSVNSQHILNINNNEILKFNNSKSLTGQQFKSKINVVCCVGDWCTADTENKD